MTAVTVNGNTYSDDGTSAHDMQAGGYRSSLLPMVSDTMIDTAAKVAAAAAQVALANAAAAAAAVSASTAVSGPGSNGTSTTSLTIGLGAQSLAIQTGKTLSVGMPMTIASTASPQNWMNGSCTSYNSGTGALVVNVTNIGVVTPGVYPTLAAWTISLSGPAAVSGVLNELKGASVASASTVNLDITTGNLVHLTGSVAVNAFTLAQGAERTVIIDAAPLINFGANLDLPGGANIQAAAGDRFIIRGDGGSKSVVIDYIRANGAAVVVLNPSALTLVATLTPTAAGAINFLNVFTAAYDNYLVIAEGLTVAVTDSPLVRVAVAGVVDSASNYFAGGASSNSVTAGATNYMGYTPTTLAGGKGLNFNFTIHNVNDAATLKTLHLRATSHSGAGAYSLVNVDGVYTPANVVSGFSLVNQGGNNFGATGKVRVYGYNN